MQPVQLFSLTTIATWVTDYHLKAKSLLWSGVLGYNANINAFRGRERSLDNASELNVASFVATLTQIATL